ncbi:MAG: hypothetical protein WBB46_11200 [Candidatus Deferrimicrobiaceae bacterium]
MGRTHAQPLHCFEPSGLVRTQMSLGGIDRYVSQPHDGVIGGQGRKLNAVSDPQLAGDEMASRRQAKDLGARRVWIRIKWAALRTDVERGRCITEARMRAGSAAKTVAGVLAVAGMLALSSPGVRVARAGDGDTASSELSSAGVSSGSASGACRGGAENNPRATRSGVSVKIAERLQAEMRSSGEKPVVLNGRGYNYSISRDPQRELRMVESEATRQQEQAPAGR